MGSYLRPADLGEALEALRGNTATILAGGTDFYPGRVGRALDDEVVDITAIEGLRGIREADGAYVIGALTTWSDLMRSKLPPFRTGAMKPSSPPCLKSRSRRALPNSRACAA